MDLRANNCSLELIVHYAHPSLPRLLQLLRQPLPHLREALVIGVYGDSIKQLGVVVDEVEAFDEVHIGVFAGGDDFAGDLAVGFEIGDLGLRAPGGGHPEGGDEVDGHGGLHGAEGIEAD